MHQLTYQQFLVGEEILVVPVLDKGKRDVKAYFPIGENCSWKHIWTGETYTQQGIEVRIEAPLGYPAVFVKYDSPIGETFLNNLRDLNIVQTLDCQASLDKQWKYTYNYAIVYRSFYLISKLEYKLPFPITKYPSIRLEGSRILCG